MTVNEERIRSVRERMAEERLDALVVRLPENVLFLSGYWPLNGISYLNFPLEGRPVCVVPDNESSEAAADIWDAELRMFTHGVLGAGDPYADTLELLRDAIGSAKPKRVGFEGSFEQMAPAWNCAEPAFPGKMSAALIVDLIGAERLVDASGLLYDLRSRKNGYELDKLRIVNEISCFGLEAFRAATEPGRSGVEILAEVERAVLVRGTGYRGAKRVRAFAQISAGAAETSIGYRPMEITTTRKLLSGDIALLELGVVADGYWADRTRPRTAGKPDEWQEQVFDIVRSAQQAAIGSIRDGAVSGEVDEAARSVVRDAGFGGGFVHVTGHGIGFRYHEPIPLIAPGGGTILRSGMVHSVEPGIYTPRGGIRIEDDIAVSETGAEILGPFPSSLAD